MVGWPAWCRWRNRSRRPVSCATAFSASASSTSRAACAMTSGSRARMACPPPQPATTVALCRRSGVRGVRQHQLRVFRVEPWCVGVEQVGIDPARADAQRRPRRQQGRARHGPCPAQHPHVAEAALVLRMAPLRPDGCHPGGAVQPGSGRRRARMQPLHAQVVPPDFARLISSAGGEQARCECQQRQRPACLHARRAHLQRPCVARQSRGQVHCQHRCRVAAQQPDRLGHVRR